MNGFQIIGFLSKAYAPSIDGMVHLDSVLSYATAIKMNLPPNKIPQIIDIPLQKIWSDQQGKSLWASTNLAPDYAPHKSTEYWHKRLPVRKIIDLCEKPNTPTTRGQYKEYRIPVSVQYCEKIVATGVGDINQVADLLKYITHVGKKTAIGKGRITWKIEEYPVNIEDILSAKPVPIRFFNNTVSQIPENWEYLGNVPWTPPYWYRPWHEPCVRSTLLTA